MQGRGSSLSMTSEAELGVQESQLIQGLNAFSFELHKKFGKRRGNLFFSPFSVWTALGMVYAGARKETARQMADVLGFPPDREAVGSFFRDLLALLNDSGEHAAIHLAVANALWPQRGYPFSPDFLSSLSLFSSLCEKMMGAGISSGVSLFA